MDMDPQVGAASSHVRDLLTGEPRGGVVRHVGRERVALEVSDRLLVVVRAAGPDLLPCSVVVPGLDVTRLTTGDATLLGGGGLALGDQRTDVVRWWEPARVRPGRTLAWGRVAPQPVLDDDTRLALHEAVPLLQAGHVDAAARTLVEVLGRGRGSTPDADDAVAGVLLAARAASAPSAVGVVERVGALVGQAAPSRTTLLSTELLRAAAGGFAAPAVVRHLTRPDAHTAAEVLRLGATSGGATLEGVDILRQGLPRPAREEAA
jgi:hypothetical protein